MLGIAHIAKLLIKYNNDPIKSARVRVGWPDLKTK